MQSKLLHTALAAALSAPLVAMAAPTATQPDEVDDSFMNSMVPHTTHGASRSDGLGTGGRFSSNALGVDSLANFSGYFYEPGIASYGGIQFTWPYTMVGSVPSRDDDATTVIGAPIVPVIIDLRNYDGSPRYYTLPDGTQVRMILDPTATVSTVLNSPSFVPVSYGGHAAQFDDAMMRAQFKGVASSDWHTLLRPTVKATQTMVLIRGTYRYNVYPDGHLHYVLVDYNTFSNELFPATSTDTSTPIGAAENAGDITTKDMSTFLFRDTYLYFNGNPSDCCVIGYHSYDTEPGDSSNGWRERRYVMNYSSFITPGVFRNTSFLDVVALSHELSETFDDPFVGNSTPVWLSPNGNCQSNLETGDVIEGLPNAITTIVSKGYTYHMQNEALLEWFAGANPSPALNGAYSWPDPTVLTAPAQLVYTDCATPFVF